MHKYREGTLSFRRHDIKTPFQIRNLIVPEAWVPDVELGGGITIGEIFQMFHRITDNIYAQSRTQHSLMSSRTIPRLQQSDGLTLFGKVNTFMSSEGARRGSGSIAGDTVKKEARRTRELCVI